MAFEDFQEVFTDISITRDVTTVMDTLLNPGKWENFTRYSSEGELLFSADREQSQIYDGGWVSLACFGKLWRARSRLYRKKCLLVSSDTTYP